MAGVNPYETDPARIPADDPFHQRSPNYGRYLPRVDDFQPRYNDWCQSDPSATEYWEDTVRALCIPENSLHLQGERQAYAAGSIIIRVDQEDAVGEAADKFLCLNANELNASRKAEHAFRNLGVAVPTIYYCGIIDGKNVTVEARIPGVSLDVAWRYLNPEQVEVMKQQCRIVSHELGNADSGQEQPSYVCPELNSHLPLEGAQMERDLLFGDEKPGSYLLVHNNILMSNIVVNNHRIVGLMGWRYSGYFGFGRADKVHRRIRVPRLVSESESGPMQNQNVQTWTNLYEGLPGTAPEPLEPTRPVKVEPSSTNLNKVPLNNGDVKHGIDTQEEHPTPKNLASLKNRNSRASSSDRSSPSNSTKGAAKRAGPGTKKGIGRKTSIKKSKLDIEDNESVCSRRSQTPSSGRTSKAPAKKQSSASLANSPAPEPKRKGGRKSKVEVEEEEVGEEGEEHEEGEDEDVSDPDTLFCICRKPDNHTWMIACDGGCEDWFHGKCVNVDPRDVELILRYICPNCKENGKGSTLWKPMCRLKECRKPARHINSKPSKYCSDEHGLEFMRQKTRHLNLITQPNGQRPNSFLRAALSGTQTPRDDDSEYDSQIEDEQDNSNEDLGSKGGVLTLGDLTAVIMGVGSAEEFRKLGAHIVAPPEEQPAPEPTETEPEVPPTKKKLGLDFSPDNLNYSPDEAEKLDKLRKRRDDLFHRRDMLAARNTFLTLVRHRSKHILEILKKRDPKGGWKDICGFDTRLAWSDEEFDEWRLSEPGKKALEEGTPEALASSYPSTNVDADDDTAMDNEDEDSLESITRGVCMKKRCERHKQWLKVQQLDVGFEERTLETDLVECEKEAQSVVERAVLRIWAEHGNAQSQLENGA
ncbi:putative PHD transcription factor [Aspergillus mulundensis]|uniref:PHD-type domain-containing protein n=1 Tax=Aspergillus mulundensis TaxID=1810919 RepID=A0A3D8SJJ7_9EURO|nr:Uncharacterized protein DSM5745_03157 [Aspergillus mulundensis]RDW86515.1 Uncharacterized protein DSM5745_03157 [Aspergillus mulundensis]